MIDVRRYHGTSCGDFVAYEFRGDVGVDAKLGTVHVLADGYIFHFRCHNTLSGIIHLTDLASPLRPQRQGDVFKAQAVKRTVITAHTPIFGRYLLQTFHTSALHNPWLAQAWESFSHVGLYARIAVWSACVVYIDRRIFALDAFPVFYRYCRHLLYDTHSDFDFRMERAFDIDFLRTGIGYFYVILH